MLKNAIDCAARPYSNKGIGKKQIAFESASPGMLGGTKAQYHLKQS
jgi:chromate reductase